MKAPFACPLFLALFALVLLAAPLDRAAFAQETPRLAAGGNAVAGDTVMLGLRSALARSLAVSPEVGQKEAQREYAEARSYQARASRFLTEFSANTAHSFAPGLYIPPGTPLEKNALYLNPDVENDWSLGALRPFNAFEIELGQPIYTWGELSGNIDAAAAGVGVEEADMRSTALEVAFRTAQAYYNLLLTESLRRLTGEARSDVERAKREVQRLLNEGDPDVSDADLFQVQLAEQEFLRRVAEVNQQRQLAGSALARQLFLPEDTAVRPDTSVLRPLAFQRDSLAAYTALALENRPELAQARAGLAARAAQVRVARSDYFPKLFFGGSYSTRYAAGRPNQESAYIGESFVGNSVQVGLSLRQNLSFFQTDARVEQARAQLSEVRYQQEAAQQLVRFEVEEAYRTLAIAEAALASRDTSLQLTGDWLRTEQVNFDLDLGDTGNLVDAVQANVQARAAYFEAVKNYNVAVLRLLRMVGLLDAPSKLGTFVDF